MTKKMTLHAVAELYSRRALLRTLGQGLAAAPVLALLDCGPSKLTGEASGSGSSSSGSSTSSSSRGASSSSGAVDAGVDGGLADVPWATGGTASMVDKASYPNPFSGSLPTTCALSCEMTEGPCYDGATVTREDISEGQDGLPLRLLFQILDETCSPVTDATLDIWHCNPVGVYSGDDTVNEDLAFCTGSNATAEAAKWFRGVGATDSQGIVAFDTCFPGWYSSRTIHIHITVRRVNTSGTTEYLTTQLFFEDTLDDEIIMTQPVYDARPNRDTTNQTDTVITPAQVENYVFATQKMTDGAMLGWKTLILRASTSEQSCSISNGTMGPGH